MKVELMPDLRVAAVTIGTKVVGIRTDQVDALIWALADIRSRMIPEVPREFPQRERIHEVREPAFVVGIDNLTRAPSFSMRTEGFGWIKFDLDREGALKMAQALFDCAHEEDDSGKPN